ncbi:Gfo/Idh/MocA family protein [Ruania alba]|uniref:Predicted dehydrogenase n=1 Tax=Ruania alba TaxID=648782 RepID=A0A1H5MJB4_9MICO|nr:Gfo/Idh/MocA family oxidoreductase [Ruania alba]SEE89283.1 Predicted dehydrogenase [Ruania alba]
MTYRAAIVGAGAPVAKTNQNLEGFSIGQAHANAYAVHPDTTLTAVADIQIQNAEALAAQNQNATAYGSLGDLLAHEQIDVLSICTWPTLHHQMVLQAIGSGVQTILCEKPMAVSLNEIDEMVRAASDAGVRLFVNHQRRFEQPYRGAKQLIDDGHLGTILRIEGFVGGGWDLMSWGSHWVDMACHLLNDPPASWLFAAAQQSGKTRYGHLVEDEMLLQIGFPNDALVLIRSSSHLSGAGLIVTGTDGVMRLAPNSANLVLRDGDENDLVRTYLIQQDKANTSSYNYTDAFIDSVHEILHATRAEVPSVIDADRGHATTELLLGAYQSANTRSLLTLPLIDRTTTLRVPSA